MDLSFVFHFMNGFDQDGVITFDWCQLSHVPLFPLVDGSDSGKAIPYLHRWTIDVNAEKPQIEFKKIDQYESEFPQCDLPI